MKLIYLAISIFALEWLCKPYLNDSMQWIVLLGSKDLLLALVVSALLIELKTTLLNRSVLALFALTAWTDFLIYASYQTFNTDLYLEYPAALLFFVWLAYAIKRIYPVAINSVNANRVAILVLRPQGAWDVFKALLGTPAASICIVADGYVWSFRNHSGKFEKSIYDEHWSDTHIVVDTGIKFNKKIEAELLSIVGTKRFPYCKCVYSIRNVLNILGGKYKIKSWFDYIPSVYAMRVLKG